MEEPVSAVADTTKEEADQIIRSDTLIAALAEAKNSLMKVGAIAPATALGNEIRKEERRRRALSKSSPEIARAMQLQRDYEDRQQIERKRMLAEGNEKLLANRKRELREVERQVRQRKNQLIELESIAATRAQMKRYAPKALGQDCRKGGGVAGRKTRFEVLDRVGKIGAGLSEAQKSDWLWFKESWDEAMLNAWGANWGGTFAAWIQGVLNNIESGTNNAFSLFVNNETRRVLDTVPALTLPSL